MKMIFQDIPLDMIYNLNELNPESKKQIFRTLLDYIRPKPEELKWTAIPWEVDLWEARKKAGNIMNRPIFIWAMNGNPLGCVCANGIEHRSSVFSNEKIVQVLINHFVPVAENCSITQRQDDLKGTFFRLIAEQGHFAGRILPTMTRQGLYICTYEGKLLASTNSTSPEHVLDMTERALLSWNQKGSLSDEVSIPEDYEKDPKFRWVLPQGCLVLRKYVRDLPREGDAFDYKYNIDFAWFTPDELTKIIPDHVQVGYTYSIPTFFTRRVAMYHLVDTVRGESPPWRNQDIKRSEMSLSVESIINDRITLILDGSVRSVSIFPMI
jgi:hypothetical protein